MKPNPDFEDPLVRSLATDASDLPQLAAAQARARQRARRRNAGIAGTAAILAVMGGLIMRREAPPTPVAVFPVKPVSIAATTPSKGFVRAYNAGDSPPDNDIPADASAHEKQLLTELRGVPLLLVKNERGEISQVHIFEQ